MLKKLLSLTLCFNLVVTPVLAQTDTSLNGAFSDMNANQLTDQETKEAENFNHTARTNRIVTEQCTGDKCKSDKADKNASVIGGDIGAAIEQNIGKLYAAIFGAGGMLISAITSAIGSTGSGSGVSAGVGALSSMTGKNDGNLSSYSVVRGKDGAKLKGEEATKAKQALKDEGLGKDMRKGKEVTSKDGNTKTEKKTDYCSKIAIASEVAAAINQHIRQKKIESIPMTVGDEQRGALEKVKMTHEERRRTSIIQATGFTGVAACYAAMMMTNSVVVDPMMIIKAGAATTLATIFHLKARKHRKATEEIDRIIQALPKTGDCNPYTKTLCFCAESTSEKAYPAEFAKVCVPEELGPNATASSTSCLVENSAGQYVADTACTCKKNNTCVKANLVITNPKFQLASNLMGQGNGALNAVLSGNFDEGKLNTAYLNTNAFTKRVLKAADKNVKAAQTNSKNKKLADDLSKVLPPNLASQVASTSGDFLPSTASQAMPAMLGVSAANQDIVDKAVKKASYESGGPGFGSSSVAEEEFTLPQMGTEQSEEKGGVEVLSFAEQAVENADITKAPETPIFDIISYRYRQSAWNKVEIKTEAENTETPKP